MRMKPALITVLSALSFLYGTIAFCRTAAEFNRELGTGVNLGNALDAPHEGDWGVTLQADYFPLIKNGGFNHIRVPIRWSTHALQKAPFTIDGTFFERVDWVIKEASDQSLPVVLNMHHYEELEKAPDEHRSRFIALWHQIAQHYKNAPATVAFEIYNEPAGAIDADRWNAMYTEVLNDIRIVNPDRMVIIGPVQWNSINALPSLSLPAKDPNLIATVHYYEPFHFTHQNASWAGPESKSWLGTTWTGSAQERNRLKEDFDRVSDWSQKNGRPVYLGEFGAYEAADMTSRALWTKTVREEAQNHKFSSAYWEFCSGFGVYDPAQRKWREPILKALTER